MNLDQFEMREMHRQLLTRNRLYLLHNLRPTETFWSTLFAREVLSQDMIDEIKACRSMSSQVGLLLDLLPARGPSAFDSFCEALLECDHSHVAEYLKTLEATDHFRHEVQPLTSEVMLDRLVSIFKKNTPTVQRFAERKFELILEEQERDLQQKETENRDLDTKVTMMGLEVSQLRNFLSSCTETSEHLVHEIERDFVSKMFLREEKRHLENLRESLQDINGFEKMCLFYTNMQKLLTYLEGYAGLQSHGNYHSHQKESIRYVPSAHAKSLHDKMTGIMNTVVDIVDDLGTKTTIPGHVLRSELEGVLRSLKDVMEDVWRIRDVFRSTIKQKRRLEGEVLSLLHNLQEIRRLEREVKEKQSHISDLNKQGAVMKKKTKHHRKQLEQIHLSVEQRRLQMTELQTTLERQLNSADRRLHNMLTLLPDLEESDLMRSDTDLTGSSGSRLNTPDTHYRPSSGAASSISTQLLRQRHLATLENTEEAGPTGEKEQREDSKTPPKSASGSVVLLERRKAKQGLLPRETSNLAKTLPPKAAKDVKLPVKSERATVVKKSIKDKPEDVESEESKVKGEGQIDIDSWVANERCKTKTDELQKKLANFNPVVTEDRNSVMENVRSDIDVKIDEIRARNQRLREDKEKEPPDKDPGDVVEACDNVRHPKTGATDISGPGQSSQQGSASRSGSGSDKENSIPNTCARTSISMFQGPTSIQSGPGTGTVQSPHRQATRPEMVAASLVCMDSEELMSPLTRQGTRFIEPDTWVPPKKRYGEREALKANKVEIRLPSN